MHNSRSTRRKHVRNKVSSFLRKHHDDVTSDDIDEMQYLIGSYRNKHTDTNGSSALYEQKIDDFGVERRILQALDNNAITENRYNSLETQANTPRSKELLKRLKRILDSNERKDELEETLNSLLAEKLKESSEIAEFLISLREYKFIVSKLRYEKYDFAFEQLTEDVLDTESAKECFDKINLTHLWRIGDSAIIKKDQQTLTPLSKEIAKKVKDENELELLKGMLQAKKDILEDQKREAKLHETFEQDDYEILENALNDYIGETDPRCNEELIKTAFSLMDKKKQAGALKEMGRILTTTKTFKREDIQTLKDLRRQLQNCREFQTSKDWEDDQQYQQCKDFYEIIDHLISLERKGQDEIDLNSSSIHRVVEEEPTTPVKGTSRHMPNINLFPVVGEHLQNKFHLSIFTTNKIVYGILKHLKSVYQETQQQRLEVINTQSLSKIFLNFNRKGEPSVETRFCKGKFNVQYLDLYDTLILLTHTSKNKDERHIAGFCILNTFLDTTYDPENLKLDWIAFEVKFLCTHDHLRGPGTHLMNMTKWFCMAINQLHTEKDGFLLQALTDDDTLAFYDKMKVLPIEKGRADGLQQEQWGTETRIWKIKDDKEFLKVKIQTENLGVGVNAESIRKQKELFSLNPQREDQDNYPVMSSSQRDSFEQSRTSSSNVLTKKRNRQKIVEAIHRLPVNPTSQEYKDIRELMRKKIANKRKRFTKDMIFKKTVKMH
jgi:hypothetical protein